MSYVIIQEVLSEYIVMLSSKRLRTAVAPPSISSDAKQSIVHELAELFFLIINTAVFEIAVGRFTVMLLEEVFNKIILVPAVAVSLCADAVTVIVL
jgi:hypothetical protein